MGLRVHITSDDVDELPKMMLDQKGTMELKFVVKGANIYDDETFSENTVSYDLDCEIVEFNEEKMSLGESLDRAEKMIRVQTQTQPSPG